MNSGTHYGQIIYILFQKERARHEIVLRLHCQQHVHLKEEVGNH